MTITELDKKIENEFINVAFAKIEFLMLLSCLAEIKDIFQYINEQTFLDS